MKVKKMYQELTGYVKKENKQYYFLGKILRREYGNAYEDSVLEDLVGKNIFCKGIVKDHVVLIKTWMEVRI